MYHITAILLIITYLPPSSVILRTYTFILQKSKQGRFLANLAPGDFWGKLGPGISGPGKLGPWCG